MSTGMYSDSYRGDMSSDMNSGLFSDSRTGDLGPSGVYSDSYKSDMSSDMYSDNRQRDNAFADGRMVRKFLHWFWKLSIKSGNLTT